MQQSVCVLYLVAFLLTVATGQSDRGFLRVSGTQFVDRLCRPFVYSGWNSWALLEAAGEVSAALPVDRSFLNGATYIDHKLDVAVEAGMTVGRVFAHGHHEAVLTFQTSPGEYNAAAWTALDTLLDKAAQRGLMLILTFSDNWKEVDSRSAYAAWAGVDASAFYTDETIRQWYKDHISTVVNRQNSINGRVYKDDPTIFAWNLMNEPRCDCDVRFYSEADCEKPCADRLQAWIEEMALFLKTQDPFHMVTVGEEGFYGLESGRELENPDEELTSRDETRRAEFIEMYNTSEDRINWAARSGQDFVRNHAPVAIDYAAIHLWPDNWGGMPIAFQTRWIEAHAEDAVALNKPLTVEEFGKTTEGNGADEISSVRDPYFQEVYDSFEGFKSSYPMGGIAFWEFDAKILDGGVGYNVYPTHSTFTDIVVPATAKIVEDLAALEPLENCFPGETRSFEALTVDGVIYITSGFYLLAVEEGIDLGDEIEVEGIEACLESCQETPLCNAVSFNRDRSVCFLKQREDVLNVDVEWSPDGWQSYWEAPAESVQVSATSA